MASIHRRTAKDGADTWRVGYRHDGRLRWTPTFSNPDGAVEMKNLIERLGPEAALAILDARTGRNTETGPMLLSDWFDRHLALLESRATPGTIADYRRMAERTWLPHLGPLPLDAITEEAILTWIATQRTTETHRSTVKRATATAKGLPTPAVETYSTKSIRNAHGLLSTTLASAVRAQHITKNVAYGLALPDDEETHTMEIFTRDELRDFIAAMQPHYRPLVTVLAVTGMRIGEATALQVRDVDLTGPAPLINVRRAWKKAEQGQYLGAPKSRRGRRPIVLPREIGPTLHALTDGRHAEDLVFTAPRGGRIYAHRFRERQWQAALDSAGITKRLTPHSLRHTAASHALMDGISPVVVQHRLGHESLDTTSKVYSHLLTGAQGAAAESASRLIYDPIPQIEA